MRATFVAVGGWGAGSGSVGVVDGEWMLGIAGITWAVDVRAALVTVDGWDVSSGSAGGADDVGSGVAEGGWV